MFANTVKKIISRLIRLFNQPPEITCNAKMADWKDLLSGRCAIITGGTSGIGFAIAKAFAQAGAAIVITGRSSDRIEKAVSKLKTELTADREIYGIAIDNRNINGLLNVLNIVEKKSGHQVDILVNNAGVNCKSMPDASLEDYDYVMDTNLKPVYFLSQEFGKYMILNKIKGNILNIASSSSLRPANSAYILSKWGIRALTLGLAKSLGKYGITVNGIAPGPTATPMMSREGGTNMFHDRIPLGRFIMPEEIANMAVFLVSDMGHSIMGDIVYMTGGAGLLTYDDVNYKFGV